MSVARLGLGGECDSSAVASGRTSEVGAVAGAEEVDEERGAEEGGDDADRQLGGGDDVARDGVGEKEEDATAEPVEVEQRDHHGDRRREKDADDDAGE